jgi:hypothetical protein
MGEKARSGRLSGQDFSHLREELDVLFAKGTLPAGLKALRNELTTWSATPANKETV